MPLRVTFEQRGDVYLPVFTGPAGAGSVSRGPGVIIAGAAETDQVGKLPGHSTLALHLEAAVNALPTPG